MYESGAQHRKGLLSGKVLLWAFAAAGCGHSPLGVRTAAFATAATTTTGNTEDAYALVDRSYRAAQTARMVAHYDQNGFDPAQIRPFLPDADRQVRSDVIGGLRAYAALLADVSSDQASKDVDTSGAAMATSLKALSANDLVKAHLSAGDASEAASAIQALGHVLLERERRRELPAILLQMQQPVATVCHLLAQDIGDPEHGGLRNELHNNYLDLLRDEKNFIADNSATLSPVERRSAIRTLPELANASTDGDRALAGTQKALLDLASTHTALATTAGQKRSPTFQLQLAQLQADARQLTSLYGLRPIQP